MRLSFGIAESRHAAAIATMRTAAAAALAARYGAGYWASATTERGVLAGMRDGRLLVARRGAAIVASCRLATKKPWAIDTSYFTEVPRAIYLTDMAVRPDYQRRGVGRALLTEAERVVREWPAQAIRLDAYDADAGAGEFYAQCGFEFMGRALYRNVPLLYYERLVG